MNNKQTTKLTSMKGENRLLKDSIARDLARIDATQQVIISMLTALTAQLGAIGVHSEPQAKPDSRDVGEATTAEIALLCSMTPKQHATMLLTMSGWTNKSMAGLMSVTDNTVKQHLSAVMKRLGVKTRGQVALNASDIVGRMTNNEYKKCSGGLPKDWVNILDPDDDTYRPLYAPVRSTNV